VASYTFLWYEPFSGDFFRIGDQPLDEVATAFSPDPLVQRLLRTGAGLVFLCCDTTRTCAKYGNRGYRFALMEAGAVWQNIDLVANSLDIPLRAFGGFVDEQCSELLALPEHVHPVLAVFLGG
jgi:SagB-type dehydrogenase family enzyme